MPRWWQRSTLRPRRARTRGRGSWLGALLDYLDNQGHWQDWIAVEEVALAAARRRGDPIGEAYAHRLLGRSYAQTAAYRTAARHYDAALVLYHRQADLLGSAHTSMSPAWLHELQGEHDAAQRERFTALDSYRQAGHQVGVARTLNAVGWGYAQFGEFPQARDHCRQALVLAEALDDPSACAAIWDSIGYIHTHLGNHDVAVDCLTRSVGLFRRVHDLFNEADALTHLGDAYAAAGRPDEARPVWESALTILEKLDHPDADAVRARLKTSAATRRSFPTHPADDHRVPPASSQRRRNATSNGSNIR